MKIQLAFDFMPLKDALDAACEVAEFVDRVECGTSLIFKDGMKAVTEFKKRLPEKKIIADLKIIDHAEEETIIAYEAGADSVTVLSCASDEDIYGAGRAARRYGKELIVELSMHCVPLTRAPEIRSFGADFLCVRTSAGTGTGNPYKILDQIANLAQMPLIAAGGVNLETVDLIRPYSPAVVIVGQFLRTAPDRRLAAKALRAKILTEPNGGE